MKLKDMTGQYNAIAIFETDEMFQDIPLTYENRDKIANTIKEQVEKQGCTDFRVEGNICYFGNQFYYLPNIPSKREGILTFRSKDYIFSYDGKDSYGNKPKASETNDNGFSIKAIHGKITYILTR